MFKNVRISYVMIATILLAQAGLAAAQNFEKLNPAELEFLITLTLVPTFSCPVVDDELMPYYDGRWFDEAQLAGSPGYSGSRFFKRGRCIVEFSHVFSDETARDDFHNSDTYAKIRENLAVDFDILDLAVA